MEIPFVNQLLSIAHEIYKSFNDEFDVRSVFLDISKFGMKVLLSNQNKMACLASF